MKSKPLDRLKRRMVIDPPMQQISMRVPGHMIEELKEIASAKGFSGYQGLIRFYVSQGMKSDLRELDRPRMDLIAKRLIDGGVDAQFVEEALAA